MLKTKLYTFYVNEEVCSGIIKSDRSSELSEREVWNFSSAAKNGKVEGGMLLHFKDQVIQTDKKLDYKVSPGYHYK